MNKLAPLRRNPHVNPDAAIGAIVCIGSDDDVAQALVAMLNDPVLRDAALGALQTYQEGKLPPLTAQLRARLGRISARADVQAALAKVGRRVDLVDAALRDRGIGPPKSRQATWTRLRSMAHPSP